MYYSTSYNSPIGELLIVSDGEAINGVWFHNQKFFKSTVDETVENDDLEIFKKVKEWLDEYFEGKNPQIDFMLNPSGSEFRRIVWKILLDIPYGETYISTGSLIVIRCDKEKIDPTYLKIFLDSDLGTTQLRRIQTGTTVLSLNPSKLHGIIVPLPSLSKQLLISSSYKYKKANLKEVKDVVSQMEEEIDKKFNRNFLAQLQ
jgi:restriction endonuclease S subunit